MVRTVVARPASPLAVLAGSFVATTVGAPIGTSLLAITTVAVAAGLLEVVAAVAITVELGGLVLAAACFFPLPLTLILRVSCGARLASLGVGSALPFGRLAEEAFPGLGGELGFACVGPGRSTSWILPSSTAISCSCCFLAAFARSFRATAAARYAIACVSAMRSANDKRRFGTLARRAAFVASAKGTSKSPLTRISSRRHSWRPG